MNARRLRGELTIALLAAERRRDRVVTLAADLHCDVRVVREVEIPVGMGRCPALRRIDDQTVAFPCEDHRRRVLATGLTALRREQQEVATLPRPTDLAAVRAELLDDLLVVLAHVAGSVRE